jgi:hypothetical protein
MHTNVASAAVAAAVVVIAAQWTAPVVAQQPAAERLRALEDYMHIEQLLMRYAAALNTGDADAYVAMFTPDAVFELKRDVDEPPFLGPLIGHEALREQWFAGARFPRRAGRHRAPRQLHWQERRADAVVREHRRLRR